MIILRGEGKPHGRAALVSLPLFNFFRKHRFFRKRCGLVDESTRTSHLSPKDGSVNFLSIGIAFWAESYERVQ